MMFWAGVSFALAASFANTGIDVLRKVGSATVPPHDLVAVVAVYDAVLSIFFVAAAGGFSHVHIANPVYFWCVTVCSSALLLLSKVLYQRAVTIAPLSLTVPYLSFTPAILMVTAFLFLGEQPSVGGVIGVSAVTAAGYLLSTRGGPKPAGGAVGPEGKLGKGRAQSLGLGSDLEAAHQIDNKKELEPLPAAEAGRGRTPPLGVRKELGSAYMIAVAVIWSVTASLDKLGLLHAPSISCYFVAQRAIIGVACLLYLMLHARRSIPLLWSHFGVMVSISFLELTAVIFFLEAIEYIMVSYVVAIKRFNILFSVLIGSCMFQEKVWHRLPYILLMLSGMLFIVLDPVHIARHSHKLPQH